MQSHPIHCRRSTALRWPHGPRGPCWLRRPLRAFPRPHRGPCWLTRLSGRGEAEACADCRRQRRSVACGRAAAVLARGRRSGRVGAEACVLPLAAAADAATIRTGSVSLVARPQFSQCGRTAVPPCRRTDVRSRCAAVRRAVWPCRCAVPPCGRTAVPPCRRTDVQSGADVRCRRAAVRRAVLPCRRAVRAAVRCRHSVVRRAAVPPCRRAARPCGRAAALCSNACRAAKTETRHSLQRRPG